MRMYIDWAALYGLYICAGELLYREFNSSAVSLAYAGTCGIAVGVEMVRRWQERERS